MTTPNEPPVEETVPDEPSAETPEVHSPLLLDEPGDSHETPASPAFQPPVDADPIAETLTPVSPSTDESTTEESTIGDSPTQRTEGPSAPSWSAGPPPWPQGPPSGLPGSGAAGPTSGPRPSTWKQFVAGALVGALVGGATAGGIYVATRDDQTSTRTVVVRNTDGSSGGNTSVITSTGDVQSIVRAVEPAVVVVQAGGGNDSGSFPFGDRGGEAEGTGFVISRDGVIVTNNHVVEGASEISVTFADGTEKQAKVLGSSADTDLAVVKVDGTDLPAVELGSSDDLVVGDEVVAIGNALALEGGLSVTRGIISAKGRTVEEEGGASLSDMLQTDAAINPGNSGGPLVNAKGQVVGINTAIANPASAQNVGFAIAIDTAKPIIEDLRRGQTVNVGYLGVNSTEVTDQIKQQLDLETDDGAVITQVQSGSAADDAGLEEEDVILAVGDDEVTNPEELGAAIRRLRPGDEVKLTIERDGDAETVTATLGRRPSQ